MTKSSLRARALRLLIDIEERKAFANLTLASERGLEPRDAALLTELVNGTTRMRRALDHVLQSFLKDDIAKLTTPIRQNLRMGAYQLLYLDRIPAHAAVDEAVKLARSYGHEGVARLTNAVLHRVADRGRQVAFPDEGLDPVVALGTLHSLPDWIVRLWLDTYGLEITRELAASSNQPTPLALRTHTLRRTREELLAELTAAGLEASPSPVVPEGIRLAGAPALASLPGHGSGHWYVQGEAAMLTSRVVDPAPGMVVADVGAAPGGKSTHLAALMEDRGQVLAIDPHEGRLNLVAENARRLGLTSITLCAQDGTEPLTTPVDAALVDAPCSGLGVLYRKADLRWHQTPERVAELPTEQLALLAATAAAVRPGGVLVYATCTLNPAENQDVVARFLAAHPDFHPGTLAPYLPEAWRADEDRGMIQLMPPRHGVEGFFIARLERSDA